MPTEEKDALLLYGNEAIARGAYEAGCVVAAGYPGTPSTEIIEALSRHEDMHVEWSTNEKVALEVAIGASISGKRAIACMKHVGLNVASDPLLTVSYMGIRGGLVIVSADDPGMHSSQNEQDNRWYGRFAKIPVLEPSDSEEALLFTKEAFRISEEFDTAVLVRTTTRVSHARSLVSRGARQEVGFSYEKDASKYVMLPGNARRRKPVVLERLKRLSEYALESSLNSMEIGKRAVGFVTGGVSYQYVREAFPEASVLKLGMAYPMSEPLIRDFASKVDSLIVVEEMDDFWESQVRAMGIDCHGKDLLPECGELSPALVERAVGALGISLAAAGGRPGLDGPAGGESTVGDSTVGDSPVGDSPVGDSTSEPALPQRPPVLCPGCPHRGVYYVLKKLNLTVAGDIGCYTLGALPPLASLDTTTCMGASIGHVQGMRLGLDAEKARKTVAVIGDSTFMHSGITPLLNMTYNGNDAPVIILDNGTTAMTGHQGHPGSGLDARHREAPKASIEAIAQACGRKNVVVVDAYDLKAVEEAVRNAIQDPSTVIIARTPCVLIAKKRDPVVTFDPDACIECGLCHRAGCPALEREGKKPKVNPVLCDGCGVCAAICPRGALAKPDPRESANKEGEDR